jgi:hypothetical protein
MVEAMWKGRFDPLRERFHTVKNLGCIGLQQKSEEALFPETTNHRNSDVQKS